MPSEGRRLAALLLFALALRLVVFPFNEHLHGDAVSRTEMAEHWAQDPHVMTSFADGTAQYGPLHLYLVGAALSVVNREDASRVVSLIFGVLTVIPVFALTRHYFAGPSAFWACAAFALWSLHLQASTTGGSEAVALFLMWVGFAWFARALYRPHWFPFVVAAVALNLAAATRYDAWMYMPLLALAPLLQWSDRRRAARYGLLFFVACLPFPVAWMWGNYAALGDPLYPLTYIDEFHRTWALESAGGWRGVWLRVQGLGFWPAMAFVTLSPGVAILGAVGMAAAWRMRPAARWLILAAIVPTVYYALRTAVLLNFVPLGRFTIVQLSLMLPFVVTGWSSVVSRYGAPVAARVARASAVLAVAVPLGLGLFTWHVDSKTATVVEPISPVATNPAWVHRAADVIRETVVEPGRTLVLDEDATYQDLQVGFFAHPDPSRTLRVRQVADDRLQERLTSMLPDTIVVFERGRLLRQPWVTLRGGNLTMGDASWTARSVDDLARHVQIFDRRPPREGAAPGS